MPRSRPLPLALALGGVLLVIGLATLVSAGLTDGFDLPIIRLVRGDQLSDVLSPLRQITELGSTWAVTIVAVVVFLVAALIESWRDGLAGAATIGLASAGNTLFKMGIARARPDVLDPLVVEHGFSFPSGHSALGMVAYGVLSVIVSRSMLPGPAKRVIIVGLGLLVFLIGLSRIYLGVHYPTDVLAGWTAGVVIVGVYAWLTRREPTEPAVAEVVADPEAPRSDPPVTA